MIKVIQIAPAVRTSISELFGLPPMDGTKKLVGLMRALGYKYVYDTPFGADLVTFYEAKELKERIKNGKLPLINSCCIGWLAWARAKHPELKEHISKTVSPQMALGYFLKEYLSKKLKIPLKEIEAHALMPCAIKNLETKETYKGIRYVDKVITMRELKNLIKGVKWEDIEESEFDDFIGSNEGARFGFTGGVTESILSALGYFYNIKIDFKLEKNFHSYKEYTIKLFNKKYKIARVFGIENFEKVLERKNEYLFIEFMACPFGCIGGNAQPLPNTEEIIKKRIDVLKNYSKKCEKQKNVFKEIAKYNLGFIKKDRL